MKLLKYRVKGEVEKKKKIEFDCNDTIGIVT